MVRTSGGFGCDERPARQAKRDKLVAGVVDATSPGRMDPTAGWRRRSTQYGVVEATSPGRMDPRRAHPPEATTVPELWAGLSCRSAHRHLPSRFPLPGALSSLPVAAARHPAQVPRLIAEAWRAHVTVGARGRMQERGSTPASASMPPATARPVPTKSQPFSRCCAPRPGGGPPPDSANPASTTPEKPNQTNAMDAPWRSATQMGRPPPPPHRAPALLNCPRQSCRVTCRAVDTNRTPCQLGNPPSGRPPMTSA